MRTLSRIAALVVVAAGVAGASYGCDRYENPPRPAIVGLESGQLADPRAPVVIDFGTSVDPSTLSVKIAFFETDNEGNLRDEDDDPESALRTLVVHDPSEGDQGARVTMEADDTRLRLDLLAALPVGPKLVLVVEAGLTTKSGRPLRARAKLLFSYTVKCTAGTRVANFKDGVYYALLDVEQPLGTQIQLYGVMQVDPNSGVLVGQFTNADRNPDRSRCKKVAKACTETEACRTLPEQACVIPSLRAASPSEYPDFVPNSTPPTGYSFFVVGCAVDDGKATGIITAPATMAVESPKVTVQGLAMTASCGPDATGDFRCTGSLTADTVFLGTNPLGAGKGTMTALRIPEDKVPPNVPRPSAPASDGGASAPDGGRDGGP